MDPDGSILCARIGCMDPYVSTWVHNRVHMGYMDSYGPYGKSHDFCLLVELCLLLWINRRKFGVKKEMMMIDDG